MIYEYIPPFLISALWIPIQSSATVPFNLLATIPAPFLVIPGARSAHVRGNNSAHKIAHSERDSEPIFLLASPDGHLHIYTLYTPQNV
jgi:hypothetical protein